MEDILYEHCLRELGFMDDPLRSRLCYFESNSQMDDSGWHSCLRVGVGDGKRHPIEMRSQLFTQILEICQFPKIFPHSMLTDNGCFAHFTDYEKIGDVMVPASLSVIFQTPYSPVRSFSCALRVSVSDRSAICLFLGNDLVKIKMLLNRIRARLKLLQHNPLWLISVLYEEYSYACEEYKEELDRDVAEMERQTGHTSLSTRLLQPNHDYEKLAKRLSACNTSVIFLDNLTVFENGMGTFCKNTLNTFETLREERCLEPLPISEIVSATQHLEYHLNLSQMRRIQAQSLQKRVQMQINVLYGLISQHDSKINVQIAIAAKRDSTVIKAISVLTLIYLPGTFVATVFGAGIFDLNSGTDGQRVSASRFWWVYCVVTAGFTLITVAIWLFYIRLRAAEDKGEERNLKKTT